MNYWPEKYRPQTLEDLVLDPLSLEYLNSLDGEFPNLLFSGPPGVGKTSTAKILAKDKQRLYINASDENGIDTIRNKVVSFSQTKSMDGTLKVVILDEADQISDSAQKALRSVMEEYTDTTRFVLTCNYLFKIIPPLQSRCKAVVLDPPISGILQRVVKILKQEGVIIPPEQKEPLVELVTKNGTDLRKTLNELQSFSLTGTLKIQLTKTKEFAEKLIKKMESLSLPELRAFWLENEPDFHSDYHQLMKQLFEYLHTTADPQQLLILADGMYKDAIVLDKELNFYATIIQFCRSRVS